MNNPTESRDIPALTAENYSRIKERTAYAPLTDAVRLWFDAHKVENVIPLMDGTVRSVDHATTTFTDITINGAPTVWTIYGGRTPEEDPQMCLDSEVPCSLDFCSGHSMLEADTWHDVRHTTAPIVVNYPDDVKLDSFGDHVVAYIERGIAGVYVDIEATDELTPANASKVADRLRLIATAVEDAAMIAAALELRATAEETIATLGTVNA